MKQKLILRFKATIILLVFNDKNTYYIYKYQLIGVKAASPPELARNDDPGLSIASEAAEVVPAESVRHNGNPHCVMIYNLKLPRIQYSREFFHQIMGQTGGRIATVV